MLSTRPHHGRKTEIPRTGCGGALSAVLGNTGALTPEQVAKAGLAVCKALIRAEKSGNTSLDIQPDNIWAGAGGVFYFFSPEPAGKNQLGPAVSGMPEYKAPEQFLNPGSHGVRAELYSLGVTLYQLAAGRLPFETHDGLELKRRHLKEFPRTPSFWNESIPGGLEYIIMRCLEKEPSARYQTPEEMTPDLKAFLAGKEPPSLSAAKENRKTLLRRSRFVKILCQLAIPLTLFPALFFIIWKNTLAPAPDAGPPEVVVTPGIHAPANTEDHPVSSIYKPLGPDKKNTAETAENTPPHSVAQPALAQIPPAREKVHSLLAEKTPPAAAPEKPVQPEYEQAVRQYRRKVIRCMSEGAFESARKLFLSPENPETPRDGTLDSRLKQLITLPEMFAARFKERFRARGRDGVMPLPARFVFADPVLVRKTASSSVSVEKIVPPVFHLKIRLHSGAVLRNEHFTLRDLTPESQKLLLAGIAAGAEKSGKETSSGLIRDIWLFHAFLRRESFVEAEKILTPLPEEYRTVFQETLLRARKKDFRKKLLALLKKHGCDRTLLPAPEEISALPFFTRFSEETLDAFRRAVSELEQKSIPHAEFKIYFEKLHEAIGNAERSLSDPDAALQDLPARLEETPVQMERFPFFSEK